MTVWIDWASLGLFYILVAKRFQSKEQGNISRKIKVIYHRPLDICKQYILQPLKTPKFMRLPKHLFSLIKCSEGYLKNLSDFFRFLIAVYMENRKAFIKPVTSFKCIALSQQWRAERMLFNRETGSSHCALALGSSLAKWHTPTSKCHPAQGQVLVQ